MYLVREVVVCGGNIQPNIVHLPLSPPNIVIPVPRNVTFRILLIRVAFLCCARDAVDSR